MSTFTRKLCSNERLWVAVERLNPSFCSQLCVSGDGRIELTRLEHAVQVASQANPGSRLHLRGHLWFSRWVDSGRTPPIEVIDGSAWDGWSPQGLDFQQTFRPRAGPTSGVIVLEGEPQRLIFRSLHATMDGAGLLTWMEDIFRVLRDEPPIGAMNSISDVELAKELKNGFQQPPVHAECLSPLGAVRPRTPPWEMSFDWRRIRLEGPVHNLLGRVIRVVADEAFRRADEEGIEGPDLVRVSVPVDMRRHHGNLRSTSNLTSGVFVAVDRTTTIEEIKASVRQQIADRRDLDLVLLLRRMVFVPLSVVCSYIKKDGPRAHLKARYASSATVSTLGKLSLDRYRCPGFDTRELFVVPSTGGVDGCPLTVALAGAEGAIDIALTASRAHASEGRLEQLARTLDATLREAVDSSG